MKKITLSLILNIVIVLISNNYILIAQNENKDIDLYDKSGGFARYYTMGAGGFGQLGGMSELTHNISNNPYIIDPSNIITNPAWLVKYPNFISGFIESSSSFMVSIDVGVGLIVGVKLGINQNYTSWNSLLMLRHPYLPSTIVSELTNNSYNLENEFGIFVAKKFDKVSIGAGITYVGDSYSNVNPTDEYNNGLNILDIYLGMLAELENMKLDIALNVAFPSASSNSTSSFDGYDGSYSFTILELNSRIIYDYNKNISLVPILNFKYLTGSMVSEGNSNPLNNFTFDMPSSMSIDLGFGLNYRVGRFLFVGGPSLSYNSLNIPILQSNGMDFSEEESQSQFIFPRWNIGAEWYCTNWLIARIGYVGLRGSESYTRKSVSGDDTDTYTINNNYISEPGMRYGLGFRFSTFSIDATISSSVIKSGLGAIGGSSTFGMMSASYAF